MSEDDMPKSIWGDNGDATIADMFAKLREVAVEANLAGPNVVETLDNIAAGLGRRGIAAKTMDSWRAISDRERAALCLIAGNACHRLTTGPGSCTREKTWTPDARYADDRWCDACIAWRVLHGGPEIVYQDGRVLLADAVTFRPVIDVALCGGGALPKGKED